VCKTKCPVWDPFFLLLSSYQLILRRSCGCLKDDPGSVHSAAPGGCQHPARNFASLRTRAVRSHSPLRFSVEAGPEVQCGGWTRERSAFTPGVLSVWWTRDPVAGDPEPVCSTVVDVLDSQTLKPCFYWMVSYACVCPSCVEWVVVGERLNLRPGGVSLSEGRGFCWPQPLALSFPASGLNGGLVVFARCRTLSLILLHIIVSLGITSAPNPTEVVQPPGGSCPSPPWRWGVRRRP